MAKPSMTRTYLITGANRGLGEGLTAAYLSRPNTTVVAAVRNPEHSTSKALHRLPRAQSSTLVVTKIDSKSETDAKLAVRDLISTHNISAVDVVIANAGIAKVLPTVAQAQASDMLEHFMVNAVAPALLFQAFLPLLRKSQQEPKFVTLSTTAASIGDMEQVPIPNAAYGTSKAALNYLTKKIHLENPDIIAFPISPGWVQTDMGNGGARKVGLGSADITTEQSISGLVDVIDNATREFSSGRFLSYDGGSCEW